MTSLRGLTDKELSSLETIASELMGHRSDQLDRDIKAGRFTPEQIDIHYKEIFDTYMATRREVEAEQLRREKNRIFRNGVFTAFAAMFTAGMVYFLFFK